MVLSSTSPDITGLILAGGASRRMGRPKFLMELGGMPLLSRVISQAAPFCREIILVTQKPTDFLDYNLKIVRDLEPGLGPLGGLATGLFYMQSPWALTLACDLPFLHAPLIDLLIRQVGAGKASGPRAFVPRTADGWQPLVAMYSKECLTVARRLLGNRRRKIEDLREHGVHWQAIGEADLRAVDPELTSFINLNTPDDIERARARLASGV